MFQSGCLSNHCRPSLGHLHYPHSRQSFQKPRAPRLGRDLPRYRGDGALLPFTPLGPYFGFFRYPTDSYLNANGDGGCLSGNCRGRQERFLPLARRIWRSKAADLSGLAFAIGTPFLSVVLHI